MGETVWEEEEKEELWLLELMSPKIQLRSSWCW